MELEARQPAHPNDYTEVDVEMAMRVLALYGGNCVRASEVLKSEGRPISVEKLRQWKRETHIVRYEKAVDELRARIGTRVSNEAMEVVSRAASIEDALMDRLEDEVHALKPGELAKAALNVAQTKRTNVEIARLLRNEPTSIVENRTVEESLDTLKDLGIAVTVEAQED